MVEQTGGYNFSINGKKFKLVKPGTQLSIIGLPNLSFNYLTCIQWLSLHLLQKESRFLENQLISFGYFELIGLMDLDFDPILGFASHGWAKI